MDREQAVKIAADYAQLVRSIINPRDIYLYGSYAKGNAGKDSDIDIAIVFDEFSGDYWETVQKLHELTISVDTRIEPVLLEKGNDPGGFAEVVRREGLKVS
ncbi:MAG: nucleotidyltransferase domain-containing protein [Clostridia bacterium]|nr:nucleotidyltransferase domain-containing protein [Clostridia bacterium]